MLMHSLYHISAWKSRILNSSRRLRQRDASVTLDPATIRLLRSLTLHARLTLLSLTAPMKIRFCHKQKRPLSRPVRVLRQCQKAAKGGKGVGEGKESPERKTVGRGKASVTLDPDTLALVNSLTLYKRLTLLSLTALKEVRNFPTNKKGY